MATNSSNFSLFETDGDQSWISCLMGSLLLVVSVPGFVINIICIVVLARYGFLEENKSNPNIFRYAFSLLICDTGSLLLFIVYGAPSNILQKWLMPRWFSWVPGWFIGVTWYVMQLHLICIAIERFTAVCKPSYFSYISGYRVSVVVIASCWSVGIVFTIINQNLLPCCTLYWYYKVYTFSYIAPDPSSNPIKWSKQMNLWHNSMTSAVLLVSYISVIVKVRMTNRQVGDTMTNVVQQERKEQEIRIAKQFSLISSFFVVTFILFRVFPYFVPPGMNWMWQTHSVLMSVNTGINGLIYLKYNPKISAPAKVLFGFAKKETLQQNVVGTMQSTL